MLLDFVQGEAGDMGIDGSDGISGKTVSNSSCGPKLGSEKRKSKQRYKRDVHASS